MSKALKICFVLLLVAATSQAAVFKVKEGGAAPYFTNLDTALWTAATYGGGPHQIEVYAGTYTTDIDLLVPSNVNAITGMEAGVIFQNPTPPTNLNTPLVDNFLDVAGSNGLTISGLHVKGYLGGIVTKGPMATSLTVEECVFEDCIVGIYVGSNAGLFDNLEIFGGWMGIGINSLAGGEAIDDNVIQNCAIHGIRRAPAIFIDVDEDFFVPGPTNAAASVDGNQVLDCQVYECTDQGIGLAGTTNTVIDGCDIYDVEFAGIAVWGTFGGTISANSIHQVAQSAINPDSVALVWNNPLGAISFYSAVGVNVTKNSVFDNGGLGTMGGGTGFAEYALGADAGCGSNFISDNCFFDHAGVQGLDLGAAMTDLWQGNYYSDLTVVPYLIDGGMESDAAPKKFNASANAPLATYEVWDEFDMTFDWSLPNCDPIDNVGLASYEFTVTYDPTKLEYVSGGYNDAFLGDTAFYAPIDETPGAITFGAANFLAPGYGNATLAFGHFKVIGFGSATVTLASTYLDSLNNPILVNNTPLVLTLTDTERPTITVVANDPVTGTNTYSNFVPLSITGVVTDNFMLSTVWYRFDNAGGWNYFEAVTGMNDTYGPYVPNIAALTEGAHNINVIVLDAAGNRDSVYYAFTIDRTAPVVTSLTLADPNCMVDPNYTNEQGVTATLVDDGTAVEMEYALPSLPEGFQPYAAVSTYMLPAVDGPYTVWVHLKDAFGNIGGWSVNDAITLDQVGTAPTGQWIVSNPTPTYTTTASVVADASFSYPTNYQYVITVDPADLACNSGKWTVLPDAANRPVALTLPGTDGVKTVYYAGRDLAGNISTVTQTITLDTNKPDFLSFNLPACANITNPIANFTWNGTADPDVKYIHLSVVSGGPYPVVIDISAQDPANASVAVPLAVGTYTVYAVLEDVAGNKGPEVSDVIVIDQTAPTAGTPRINANATWTNSATVMVAWTGLPAADAVEARFTQVAGNYTLPQNAWQPLVTGGMTYTFNPVVEDVNSNLYVQVRDCAGNISTEVVDAIRIDLTVPVVNTVVINTGNAWTNNVNVNVAMTKTELRPNQVFLSENPDMTGAITLPYGVGGPYPFVLSAGDDVSRPVYVQMSDLAGNLSNVATDDIGLDTQAPTGTFDLVQSSNPLAAPGYTNGLVIDIKNITYDADVINMAFCHGDYSGNTGWIPAAGQYLNWNLQGGLDGLRTVRMALYDAAGNATYWTLTDDIYYLTALPAGPGVGEFTVTPTGSCDLEWTADSTDAYYFFRYNASFEYPTFTSGLPPFPALDEGFFGAYVYGTDYHFDADDYPEMDILAFSLWTVDKAGNVSAAPATAIGVNYIPGDFDWDGMVEFLEFGDIAAAYLTSPNTKPHADIATLVTEDPIGLPYPDNMVDFPDLNKFAQNYVNYGDFGKSAGKAAVLGPVALSAEYPGYMPQGAEYTFSLTVDNAQPVLTYHLSFDIDEANFEIVSVEPGAMYEDGMRAFFFHNANSQNLEIDGAVFGDVFDGNEVARVTVRAKNGAQFDVKSSELVARGIGNQEVVLSFSGVRKAGLLPTTFALHQNYPNPFNPTTTISFDVPKTTEYSLVIYNLTGQEIVSFKGVAEAGVATIEWNADDVASGVYFYRLEAGQFTASKKMVLLK